MTFELTAPPDLPDPIWTIEDGITFSALSKFIICPERFRLGVVFGLEEPRQWDIKSEYGSMFHYGLERHSFHSRRTSKQRGKKDDVLEAMVADLGAYANLLQEEHPTCDTIGFWHHVCQEQLLVYFEFWKQDDSRSHYQHEEKQFDFTYQLPSGRSIRIRGMIDGVKLECDDKVSLRSRKVTRENCLQRVQENKVKGESYIDLQGINEQMYCDLQSGLIYPCAVASEFTKSLSRKTLLSRLPDGVLYNVIKRPLSETFTRIRPRKTQGETSTNMKFADRVGKYIHQHPDEFFFRFRPDILPGRMEKELSRSLDPYLEQLLNWWNSIRDDPRNPWCVPACTVYHDGSSDHMVPNPLHVKRPFGVFDPIAKGFHGKFYHYLRDGRLTNLKQRRNAFPELDG